MADTRPDPRTSIFLLHYLGGSAGTWRWVMDALEPVHRVIPLDLPGFGGAARAEGFSVREMADAVAGRIRQERPEGWILVGHSMGAKVAAAVARRAEDGAPGLAGLRHLVLLAGSPPAPEPMAAAQRAQMSDWFRGDAQSSREQAGLFVAQNVAAPLAAGPQAQAIGDLLRAAPDAWLAWLQAGSREDLSAAIGLLQTPALIVAGAEDVCLDEAAQRRLMAPHFAHAEIRVLAGAKHLLPLEQPAAIARLLQDVIAGPKVPDDYQRLIASPRVSRATRAALARRLQPAPAPRILSTRQLVLLRAVLARLIPQPFATPIDLAERIDAMLAEGPGDGWRIATQPPDAEAYRAGLTALDAADGAFDTLTTAAQDARLREIQSGALAGGGLSGAQMQVWFADLLADAVRLYMSHPATLARIGFSGIGYGGDSRPLPGFSEIGLGAREAWEPEAGR